MPACPTRRRELALQLAAPNWPLQPSAAVWAPPQPPRRSRLRTDDQGSVFLGEEILIQTFELYHPAGADSHAMFDHEVCQALAVKQDDALGEMLHKVTRLRAEGRCGHEHAFRRSQTNQTTYKGLHLGPTDRVAFAKTLCLNVNAVEASRSSLITPSTPPSQIDRAVLLRSCVSRRSPSRQAY